MGHPAWVHSLGHILVGIASFVGVYQVSAVADGDDFVGLPVDHQKIACEIDDFFLVVEVLLDDTAHAAHQAHRYALDVVEGGHEHQHGDVAVAAQVRGSPAADRPAHHVHVFH
jgi:hypothetical protein